MGQPEEEIADLVETAAVPVSPKQSLIVQEMEKNNLTPTLQGFDSSPEEIGVYNENFKPKSFEAKKGTTETTLTNIGVYKSISAGVINSFEEIMFLI